MSSEQIFFFVCFSGIVSFPLKYKKFLKFEARKFHLMKYKKKVRVDLFYFSSSESPS